MYLLGEKKLLKVFQLVSIKNSLKTTILYNGISDFSLVSEIKSDG